MPRHRDIPHKEFIDYQVGDRVQFDAATWDHPSWATPTGTYPFGYTPKTGPLLGTVAQTTSPRPGSSWPHGSCRIDWDNGHLNASCDTYWILPADIHIKVN